MDINSVSLQSLLPQALGYVVRRNRWRRERWRGGSIENPLPLPPDLQGLQDEMDAPRDDFMLYPRWRQAIVLANQLAIVAHHPVLLVTTIGTPRAVALALLATNAGIEYFRTIRGMVTAGELERIQRIGSLMANVPITLIQASEIGDWGFLAGVAASHPLIVMDTNPTTGWDPRALGTPGSRVTLLMPVS